MKVLQISASYYPALQIGGPIMAVHEFNQALSQAGVEILVLTTNAYQKDNLVLNTVQNVDGVSVIYYEASSIWDKFAGTGYQYSSNLKKAILANINNFDVIHIVGVWNYPPLVALRLAIKFKKRIVLSPHGSLKPSHMKTKPLKKIIYYHLLLKSLINKDNLTIHYFTKIEAEESIHFLKLKANVIILPNGINPIKVIRRNQNSSILQIVFVGRIHEVKGLEFLLEVMCALCDEELPVRLTIIGSGEIEYVKRIKAMIKTSQLENVVVLTGLLDKEQISHIFSISDLFVLPSYGEAFSMAILEAMAARLPVLITPLCYFPEVALCNAGKVIEHNVQNWKSAISEMISNRSVLNEMGGNGCNLVEEKYTWGNLAEEFINVISLRQP